MYGVYYSKYMLIIYFVWCCGGYVSNKSREGTWIPCKTLGESIKEKYPFSLPFVLPFEEVGDLWEFSDLPLSSGIQFLNFLLLLWFFGGKTHLLFSLILGIFFFLKMGISHQIMPACDQLCVCCPAMRTRSRQPVKRYKKLISDSFPRSPVSFFFFVSFIWVFLISLRF